MTVASQEDQAQFYVRQFDKDFGTTLAQKKAELNLLSIAKIDEGAWRLNYDETLRVMTTVTVDPSTTHLTPGAPMPVNIDVAFQKMTEATWGPWSGQFGSGDSASSTTETHPALAASRGVISQLSHEAQRPEIRKAVRVAAAYDRTHGQRP